jgi:2-keto-4-pentenoate hydratase/2-oxohepta-3-ene-1,7-dioic acid hydratase in catechol pathway
MTLYPRDIISTGSPPGTGSIKPGDIVEVTVKEIGVLRNRVKAEHDKS